MVEIARGYGTEYKPPSSLSAKSEDEERGGDKPNDEDQGSGSDGGVKVSWNVSLFLSFKHAEMLTRVCVCAGAFQVRTEEGTDAKALSGGVLERRLSAANDVVKLPDLPPTEDMGSEKSGSATPTPATTKSHPKPAEEDDFEALQRRFAALKKR